LGEGEEGEGDDREGEDEDCFREEGGGESVDGSVDEDFLMGGRKGECRRGGREDGNEEGGKVSV